MSDLTMTFDKIRQRIAEKRGYRTVIENWTDDQRDEIERRLEEGISDFYSHDWSFKKPVKSLTIVDGTNELVLPSEFGFLIGNIYFEDTAGGEPMQVQNVGRILHLRSHDSDSSGRPQIAAIDERSPGATHEQRKYLMFWPTADDDYTITLQFDIRGEALSPTNPFPYGGDFHYKTILQACLAASEQFDGELGIHTHLYAAALEMSKEYDRKVKAQTLGLNVSKRNHRGLQPGLVTYTPNL